MHRGFNQQAHIQNLLESDAGIMLDETGGILMGIRGTGGACAETADGQPLGVDRIIMQPDSVFPLHVHEGDHLLYILRGTGRLHIDGTDHPLRAGDSVYVPAEYPHAVHGPKDGSPLEFLAFGIPHHPIDSSTRMRTVHVDAGSEPEDGR